jgi:YVTN family beta-propeller protein
VSKVSPDPRIGSELLGYRIEVLLGRGGMSVVYRAEDLRLKRKVALKLLAPELAEDRRFRERFLRESELAASLDHPHIVPIYDAGEVDGQLYIAMRYVPGGDLKGPLREGIEPERALELLAQVASALDAAHARGLVHRDVKPGNVLLDSGEHCYLSDFGLTKQVSSQSGFTATGQIVGTIDYVAPEVIEGKELTAAADLYSLGCLLYECLAGEPPFHKDSEFAVLWAHVNESPPKLSERRPELPEEIDAVVAKALAKAPEKRYASARELVEEARRAFPAPALAAPRRRRWRLALAASVAIAALAIALPLTLTGGKSGPSTRPTTVITTDSIQRIDPKTNRLVATIPVGSATGFQGYQLAVGGGAVWVANSDLNRIYRIDPHRNTVKELLGNGDPLALAFGGGSLWVSNRDDQTLSQVDPRTGAILHTVSLPPGFLHGPIAAGPDAVMLEESNFTLVRIDQRSRAVTTDPLHGGSLAWGGGAFWSAESYPNTSLLKLDPATGRTIASLPISGVSSVSGVSFVFAVAFGAGAVWTIGWDGNLVRIDPDTTRETLKTTIGDSPTAIAVGEGAVWVADGYAGRVSRVDSRTGKVVATIEVGSHPSAVAVGEGGVWVAVHPTSG